MNYVRKLGFEENPDYDFSRDLFSKILKTVHENDDNIFDWTLINGGKGWEYTLVRHFPSSLDLPLLMITSSPNPFHRLLTATVITDEITVTDASTASPIHLLPPPRSMVLPAPLSSSPPPQRKSRAPPVVLLTHLAHATFQCRFSLSHLRLGEPANKYN